MAEKQKFTEKYKQLWQFIKFSLFSGCSGAVQMVTYVLLGSVLLIPLSKIEFSWWIFDYSNEETGLFNMFIAYFVSTTVGNMISFFLNRKTTFKSVKNITYSVTLTLILIFIIICYSSFFGPKINVLFGKMIPALNKENLIWIRDLIGSWALSLFTFTLVFVMDKFVILREDPELKAQNKKLEEELGSGVKTIRVVDNVLAKKYLISSLVFLFVGAISIAYGYISYKIANQSAMVTNSMYSTLLIVGSIIFGIGEILLSAFASEKIGYTRKATDSSVGLRV